MKRHYRLGLLGVALLLVIGAGVYVFLAGQNSHSRAAYLDVDPVEGSTAENETVEFSSLSAEQRALFTRAHNTTDMVEIPPDVDYDVFADNRYVRYQNRSYETVVIVG